LITDIIFIYRNFDALKLISVHYTTDCRQGGWTFMTSYLMVVQRSVTKCDEGEGVNFFLKIA